MTKHDATIRQVQSCETDIFDTIVILLNQTRVTTSQVVQQ